MRGLPFGLLRFRKPRLRITMRWRKAGIEPSSTDIQAFELRRYPPAQQREIVKLIARRPVVSPSDIADAAGRTARRAQRTRQLTTAATSLGFVLFALGAVQANRHEPAPAGIAAPAAASAVGARDNDGHWSPGGLDEADRAFFADLQAGKIPTATAAPRPQPRVVAAPAIALPVQPSIARPEITIQLGAFADAALAEARWQALSTQFPSLRPLTQTVSAVARDGRTFYRLRARGADAADTCSALAGAGTGCFVAADAG